MIEKVETCCELDVLADCRHMKDQCMSCQGAERFWDHDMGKTNTQGVSRI
jgi:hypothetical protein